MIEAWSIPDPAGRPLEEVRAIRDSIDAHAHELSDTKLEAIRAARTARQPRLAQMRCDLGEEFEVRQETCNVLGSS